MLEPFDVHLSRQAVRSLRRVDAPTRLHLGRALDRLRRDPFDPSLDIRPVRGQVDIWRVRVGEWRILYSVHLRDRVVVVALIAPRGAAYR